MKLVRKLIVTFTTLLLLLSPVTYANEKFNDPNIASFINDSNSKFLVAELNTGKIIAGQNIDNKISYKNLINKIAVFALSEKLKTKELTLNHRITITEDETLKKLNISKDVNIKDIIFLLEQADSPTLAISVLKALNIELSQAQSLLDKLTLSDTELVKLEISGDNKISAKNLAYLNQETLRNFYNISQITSQANYTLENGTVLTNDIQTKAESTILGLSHEDKNSEIIINKDSTNFLIILLESSHDSNTIFENLNKLYPYLFSNYAYQAVIQAGNHNINNQDIVVDSAVYDLFYKNHNISNLTFHLMNDKIILLQNYNTLSANNASVFSTYKSTSTQRSDIKESLTDDFKKNTTIRGFSDKEKLDSIISNTSYIISVLLLAYLTLYSVIYIFKKIFRRKS
ncbi:MAG: hypothetical protein Q3988_04965 [Gemella sp.]|nr:hypothetical protein [Gemella sp.]